MSTQQTDAPSVSSVMLKPGEFPIVDGQTMLKATLEEMADARLGVVCVVSEEGVLEGVFTDGDIRRKLLQVQKPFSALFSDDVIDHVTLDPACIYPDQSLKQAVELMEEKQVWDLPVVDEDKKLLGLLHLHPVVKSLLGE